MADSTSDATAANADTLRHELRKILTEIFSYSGGEIKDRGETDGRFGVLKAIDEAIRILSSLREVESKKTESDIPSSASPKASLPEVPQVFKCTLSNAIMSEPVVIASGQTYEKSYITHWLTYNSKCPKSNEVLSNSLWTPNHLVDELITQWCRDFKYDRLKPPDEIATELSGDGIESLLQRISSPSSVEDQREASKELRCQTKKFPNVRRFLGSPGMITRLLSPLSALDDSGPELHENIVTALFNISIVEDSKTTISANPLVIPLLTKSLRRGTFKARRNSAATLLSLLAIPSNMLIIGGSYGVLEDLVQLIREGDLLATLEAANVVFILCLEAPMNSEPAISALIGKMKKESNATELLGVLSMLCGHKAAIFIMEDKEFTKYLFSFLRKASCSANCGDALAIVLNMLSLSHLNRVNTSLAVVDEEELKYGTFTKLARTESDGVAGKAKLILQWLKRFGSGKEPQKG